MQEIGRVRGSAKAGNTYTGLFNPLPLLFKALLHGQKDRVFFSGHLIYILQQERFRAFMPAQDI
jgi:hypothetical protein